MKLIQHNILKLEEIKELIHQLPSGLFTQPKEVLSQSTIGQHFRHILEFYICLQNGLNTGSVCYDERDRDILIETNIDYASGIIEQLNLFLNNIKKDSSLEMKANYSATSDDKIIIQTSLYRELAYALDHTIHHLAIIKIGLTEEGLEMDSNLGVAPSTIRHRKVCVQ